MMDWAGLGVIWGKLLGSTWEMSQGTGCKTGKDCTTGVRKLQA